MVTVGVDLASQAERTGACVISWSAHQAVVTELVRRVDDPELVRLIAGATKVGIDIPLGWPIPFVEAVTMHSRSGRWPHDYQHSNVRAYRYRQTDLWVQDELKGWPLSVSTDLIAIPAMRAAAILARLPMHVALDGSDVVVEVYPAGALRRWGFASQGYKGRKNNEVRRDLVQRFAHVTQDWLRIRDDFLALCSADDNAFDALIAALAARAAWLGLTDPIPLLQREAARREGWIALPVQDSLHRLCD